jgi:hypothetical protein
MNMEVRILIRRDTDKRATLVAPGLAQALHCRHCFDARACSLQKTGRAVVFACSNIVQLTLCPVRCATTVERSRPESECHDERRWVNTCPTNMGDPQSE